MNLRLNIFDINHCSPLPFMLQEELLIQHYLSRFIAAIYS